MRALLLSAGLGKRLRPLTDGWPKGLMPIKKRPLLEYWLETLRYAGVKKALVNLHYLPEPFKDFLAQPQYRDWVQTCYEPELLGTAGTLRANADFFDGDNILLIHADNYCCCDFQDFIDFHIARRPVHTVMTMMTFTTTLPKQSGIVKIDERGVVQEFHEKIENPPGDRANAAIYILSHPVLEWLTHQPSHVTDMSTQVIPHFLGKIASWHNGVCHRDIGTLENLRAAQHDPSPKFFRDLPKTEWQRRFEDHPIHNELENPHG